MIWKISRRLDYLLLTTSETDKRNPGVYKVHVSVNPGNRIIMTHLVLARKKMTFPNANVTY